MNSNCCLISSVVCSTIIRQSRFGRWAGGVHCASGDLLKSILVLRSTPCSEVVPLQTSPAVLFRRTCSTYELRRVKRKKRGFFVPAPALQAGSLSSNESFYSKPCGCVKQQRSAKSPSRLPLIAN